MVPVISVAVHIAAVTKYFSDRFMKKPPLQIPPLVLSLNIADLGDENNKVLC